MTEKKEQPNLLEELNSVAKGLWEHMQWDLIEDDRIYPIQGHQEQLMEGLNKYNNIVSSLGDAAPEYIKGKKLVILNGKVKEVPQDYEVKNLQ